MIGDRPTGLMTAAPAASVRLRVASEPEPTGELDARGGDDDPLADPDRFGEDPIGGHAHQAVETAVHRGADAFFVARSAHRQGARSWP